MNSSFTAEGTQWAWDSTSIALAERCLRKYQYTMIEGWQPKEKSVHLLFGGWFASALEHYHKFLAAGATHYEATRDVVQETLIATWQVECKDGSWVFADNVDPHTLTGNGRPWDSGHNNKTRGTLIRTIVWYLDHFADESCETIKLSDGSPAVELSFQIGISDVSSSSVDMALCGHLDRLVMFQGHPYVMDQKTTVSTPSANYFDQWSPDIQMSCYTWAGQILYNIPVSGVILDVAQIAVGFSNFSRGFVYRSKASLQEWYEMSMQTIAGAVEATKENYFPMNRTACNDYGGCPFRKVCSRSPEVRPNLLAASFVRGEAWDPAKQR